ncbi:hypothetical protein [Ornithinicoccus hortensis]|uniref:Uncharacterized protein n=1 Tax=Ornithinicoccus hortensis TaxID=82346 RepID=A0A542YRA9_9MICO|nr:hypothetical protein [Ornithinicoccus hortensis]TQL50632.1 hypothetical protein FB467_1745 [Ornithinicoccus hortensis]
MAEAAPESEEDDGRHVGSVEEEAHALVRAAAAWFGTQVGGKDTPADEATEQATSEESGPRYGGGRGAGAPDSRGAGTADSWGAGTADEQTAGEQHREQVLCTGCPWCRAKAAAGPIGSDTLDSLADLLASAAVSLRHFADSRRAGHERAEGPTGPGPESSPEEQAAGEQAEADRT